MGGRERARDRGSKNLQPVVGARAHRERDLVLHEARHHGVVLEAPHAVVDALDLQVVERFGDVRRVPLFARVRNAVQPRLARLTSEARCAARRWDEAALRDAPCRTRA